jgi:L-rhamnose isomerase
MFGSVHPTMALEVIYQLWKNKFDGHIYFDTFPQRTDPVLEAEYNIRKVKALWKAASSIDQHKIQQAASEHDAIAALQIANDALRA